ncbi:unnamed protein product, partial [Prorocentrum cordatum]
LRGLRRRLRRRRAATARGAAAGVPSTMPGSARGPARRHAPAVELRPRARERGRRPREHLPRDPRGGGRHRDAGVSRHARAPRPGVRHHLGGEPTVLEGLSPQAEEVLELGEHGAM